MSTRSYTVPEMIWLSLFFGGIAQVLVRLLA